MNLLECRYCKKAFFTSTAVRVCPNCRSLADEHFEVILEYLGQNPRSNAITLSRNLSFSIKEILGFMDDGWLVQTNDGIACKGTDHRLT